MILIPANPLLAPLILLVWAIDAYVALIVVRLLARLYAGEQLRCRFLWLERVADAPAQHVRAWLTGRRRRPVPQWVAWSLIIGLGLLCRQLIVAVLIRGAP
jgi:hypothetical protein